MPARITISMISERDFPLPRFTGHIARGLLLHIIRKSSPSMAQDLHELNVLKPYTVDRLHFRKKYRTEDGYIVDSSCPCTLDVRVLEDGLEQDFASRLSLGDSALIRDNELRFSELFIDSKSYASILDEAAAIDRFTMEFITPTYFSQRGAAFFSLLPEPQRVMMNLLRVWKAFAEVSDEDYEGYREWVGKSIGITAYDLRTVSLSVRGVKAKVGFTGSACYAIRSREEKYSKLTDALLTFAEYSNVGGGRTTGMGVVRVWKSGGRTPPVEGKA